MSLLVQPELVSTIIPVFNRPEMIVESVNSVLAQTYRPIEVLIVDDGSTDETPAVLQALSDQHKEVRVFSQNNTGPGSARELGRINARGEYIQYLDSDDLLLPNKFEEQIRALERNPEADVCYGKTEAINYGDTPLGEASRLTGRKIESMFPSFLRERWWFTSTPLYRRGIVEDIGPWSPESNEEDWEYDCRIAARGGLLARVNSFVSLHRRHDSHLSEGGSVLPEKLAARAISRAKIFQHGRAYESLPSPPIPISKEDWRFFSNYAFLLCRQCALVDLKTEARAMLAISIDSLEKKTWQHIIFIRLIKFFGWHKAALLITKIKG
ncbi:MAG: glycosyltransferase [Gammaproteobacteria bacterium]|nr:glycosyltransferase [Gammaproteobacteria bacterium]